MTKGQPWPSSSEHSAVALKSLIRLGCLVQRLTVYTVATVNSHFPIALDNQPANLCIGPVGIFDSMAYRDTR